MLATPAPSSSLVILFILKDAAIAEPGDVLVTLCNSNGSVYRFTVTQVNTELQNDDRKCITGSCTGTRGIQDR